MATKRLDVRSPSVPRAAWIGLAIVALAGLAAWISQLVRGMADLGLGQQVVWGLYIAGFFAAAGAGAGLAALAGLHEFRPWLTQRQQHYLLAGGLAGFIVAGLLILMDVGSPLGVWLIAVSGRWASPMVWDFYLLAAGVVMTGLAWWVLGRAGLNSGWRKAFGASLALGALALVLAESWMLSSQAAHPVWESGLTALSFLAGAAIGALGLAVLLLDGAAVERVRSWLLVGLVLAALISLADVMAGLLSTSPRVSEAARIMLLGSASPLFWAYLLVGLVLPMVLLLKKRASRAVLATAGALAVLGVLLEKTLLLAVGQAQVWLPEPAMAYLPTWIEVVAVVGMAATGALAYGLLRRLDPARNF